MDKYLTKRKSPFDCAGQTRTETSVRVAINGEGVRDETSERPNIDVEQLPSNPGLRNPINSYNVNDRDLIRRAYIQRGPCQPRNHEFPIKKINNKERKFCLSWYDEHPTWLEYSIAKNCAFCYCYLFGGASGSSSPFIKGGLSNWKKAIESFKTHIAKSSSAHNQARIQYESFNNQKDNIQSCIGRQSYEVRTAYRIRLIVSIDCVRFLLRQGMAFRGHDESEDSNNQGNFLELLNWLCDHYVEIDGVALKNAPKNLQLKCPSIQKDIVSAIASRILHVIINDIGDGFFATDRTSTGTRGRARILVEHMRKFQFSFNLHLMKKVLGISNELSKALQRKEKYIVNAMQLVKCCKTQLQEFRQHGWDSFLESVCSFCEAHDIIVPNSNENYTALGKSRCEKVTNFHHYKVEIFNGVIDMQLQELNDRFSEINSGLLICVQSLCPNNSFVAFDKNKFIQLCGYYPLDFDKANILELDDQLDTYILDMRTNKEFEGLGGLSDLAKKLFAHNKHLVYPLVYKLLTLALILPVATASVEITFSAMTYVKNRLRNRMSDR